MNENLIDVTITNKDLLDNLVSGLSVIDKNKAIRGGLMRGGQVLRRGGIQRLKARMKSGPKGKKGNLLRSFIVRVKRNKPGVLAGFKQGEDGGSHAHLVDLGTIGRMQKSKNKKRGYRGGSSGRATPNYFWTETEDSDYVKALSEIQTGIEGFVEKVKAKC